MSFDDTRRTAAMEARQDLRPAGLGAPGPQDPAAMEAQLALARCMRENSVPEFSGPHGGGRFVVGPGPGGLDPNSLTFQTALLTCGAHVQGTMRGTAP